MTFVIIDPIKDEGRHKTQFNILLIEDNPTDALLIQSHVEKLADFSLHIVETLSQASNIWVSRILMLFY